MHSMKKRIFSVIFVVLVAGLIFGAAVSGMQILNVQETEGVPETEGSGEETATEENTDNGKETITLWYTDDALTDYLNSVAVSYADANENVRVIPELVSGSEYLENISAASVENEHFPDLYITTNDNLEKAHLAGLAAPVEAPDGNALSDLFPESAIDSCTYEGEMIAYPLYFECAVFLYNSTYMDDWLSAQAQAIIDTEEGEAAQAEIDNADGEISEEDTDSDADTDTETDPELQRKLEENKEELREEYFPTTIDKLLAFSDMYDAPEQVDGIFRWDVTDILYNYFFIGSAVDVGGKYGDDRTSVDIYNEKAIRGLNEYQDLNRFFSISTEDINYHEILDDFIDGKILFTIVTTDALKTLSDAVASGDMKYEYGFSKLPDIMDGMEARSMSVTDVIAVNGFSEKKDEANAFAAYLCELDGGSLYSRAGKISALKESDYGDLSDEVSAFMSEYENSVPLPKMMETSNLWVQFEILFSEVWDGDDANTLLKELSEQMMLQITGEEYTEDTIVIEEDDTSEEDDEIIETDTLDEMPAE